MSVRHIKNFAQAVQELSLARSLNAIMKIVRREARVLTGSDGATFVLRDFERCFYADEEAISPLWKGEKFPMNICISGWVMMQKRSVIIEDVFADSRIPADIYRATFVKSMAMVPIRTQNPLGAIGVYWARHYVPSDEEMELLKALADSVSVALENVQLYEDLEQKVLHLDTAHRMKDEFLMTLSHELRTPLNMILGWASLLQAGTLDRPELADGLRTIIANARSQAHIIDDMLDTSRMVSGQLHFQKRPLDPAEFLQVVLESVGLAAEAKGILIEASLDQAVGTVVGDAERLQQVFWNLLTNAIKFTPKGGSVKLKLERVGSSAVISIEDTGEGIAPEFLPFVFDRFRQADSSRSRRFGGMGLGLAIVRHLVESHGGTVSVSSEGSGQGSIFSVSLPLIAISLPKQLPQLEAQLNEQRESSARGK